MQNFSIMLASEACVRPCLDIDNWFTVLREAVDDYLSVKDINIPKNAMGHSQISQSVIIFIYICYLINRTLTEELTEH